MPGTSFALPSFFNSRSGIVIRTAKNGSVRTAAAGRNCDEELAALVIDWDVVVVAEIRTTLPCSSGVFMR